MVVVRRQGDDISTVEEREHGFRAAFAAAGITTEDTPSIFAPGHLISAWDYLRLPSLADHPDVYAIAASLKRLRPTAAFAINDITGVLTILAAHRLGWRVPETLSVVGFGDDSHSLTTYPPLTTIHQDPLEMGRQAMLLLVDRLETPAGEPRVIRLPVHLVVRAVRGHVDPQVQRRRKSVGPRLRSAALSLGYKRPLPLTPEPACSKMLKRTLRLRGVSAAVYPGSDAREVCNVCRPCIAPTAQRCRRPCRAAGHDCLRWATEGSERPIPLIPAVQWERCERRPHQRRRQLQHLRHRRRPAAVARY